MRICNFKNWWEVVFLNFLRCLNKLVLLVGVSVWLFFLFCLFTPVYLLLRKVINFCYVSKVIYMIKNILIFNCWYSSNHLFWISWLIWILIWVTISCMLLMRWFGHFHFEVLYWVKPSWLFALKVSKFSLISVISYLIIFLKLLVLHLAHRISLRAVVKVLEFCYQAW